jgi:hypothetical protein
LQRHTESAIGVQLRRDWLSPVALYHTQNRRRLSTTREDEVVPWISIQSCCSSVMPEQRKPAVRAAGLVSSGRTMPDSHRGLRQMRILPSRTHGSWTRVPREHASLVHSIGLFRRACTSSRASGSSGASACVTSGHGR